MVTIIGKNIQYVINSIDIYNIVYRHEAAPTTPQHLWKALIHFINFVYFTYSFSFIVYISVLFDMIFVLISSLVVFFISVTEFNSFLLFHL